MDNLPKKRAAEDFEVGAGTCAVGYSSFTLIHPLATALPKKTMYIISHRTFFPSIYICNTDESVIVYLDVLLYPVHTG